MQTYYIYFEGINSKSALAMKNKINMQVEYLQSYTNISTINVPTKKKSCSNLIQSLRALLPYLSRKYEYCQVLKEICLPDFLIVRKPMLDEKNIEFLMSIKEKYRKCKIILEMPTYPYDKEYSGIKKMIFLKDKKQLSKLENLIDHIFVITNQQNVNILWNIPASKYINGYQVDSIRARVGTFDTCIRLIIISTCRNFHAYERLFLGLGEYYKNGGKREIRVSFIGDGPEMKKYKRIIKKNSLERRIMFYGMMEEKEIDEIYNNSDIAIGSLGGYKINLDCFSSLKTREYLARGIPIAGCKIDVFENADFKYFLEEENNANKINIARLIQFYDAVYGNESREEIIHNIRRYAKETIDMSVTMAPIVNYLKENVLNAN